MPEFNIKISELNRVTPNPPFTEDFFPLVHSASMTTYRATLQDIGSLMTQSISSSYSKKTDIAVSASWASASISSSYARTASYAISASYASLATSASYYPAQQFPLSSSWASRSLVSLYSTRSIDVDTHGTKYDFPYWASNTPGGDNGNLLPASSPLTWYPTNSDRYGVLVVDTGSTLLDYDIPYPVPYPNFKRYVYNALAGAPSYADSNLGIQTSWPIVSYEFVGTDHKSYFFTTSSITGSTAYDPFRIITNSYYSGSAGDASSGSFYTIPEAPGAMASVFNGKWVRFVSSGGNPGGLVTVMTALAKHAPMGEMRAFKEQLMRGLISIVIGTQPGGGGSNRSQQIELFVHGNAWDGGHCANVLTVNDYGGAQIIRAFRISTKGGGLIDPVYAIDMLIDGLYSGGEYAGAQGEPILNITLRSWHGLRFLKWLNVDPWPMENTGSNNITQDDTQLIFPVAPGFYSNTNKAMNYYIQGKNVVIWPNYNELTQSGLANPSQTSTYGLNVSGSINSHTKFYCSNQAGLTTTATYGSNTLTFVGGILVGKSP